MSHNRINNIMVIFRMVMNEAVEEFKIDRRFLNIKPLKIIKQTILPLALEEVITFLKHVPAKYHDYYIVRFFTGMRTAEIDGLQGKFVDFASSAYSNRIGHPFKTSSNNRSDSLRTSIPNFSDTDCRSRQYILQSVILQSIKWADILRYTYKVAVALIINQCRLLLGNCM